MKLGNKSEIGLGILWFVFVNSIVSLTYGVLVAPADSVNISRGTISCMKQIVMNAFYHKKMVFCISAYILIAVFLVYYLKKKEKYTSRAVVLLWSYVLLGTIGIVFKDFILGRALYIYRDIGGDTFDQYCPVYYGIVRRIRSGTFSTWNWDYGLGTSMVCNLTQLLEPFGFMIVIVGVIFGTQTINYMLVVTQILKIIICFFLCRRFLKLFGLSENACCLASYLYALSGYLLLWGQHYLMGIGCVLILMALYAMEKFLRDGTVGAGVRLTLVVAACMIWSYYMGYMALAFSALYFLIALFRPGLYDTARERFRYFYRCAFYVIDGMIISCITLIPAYTFLTSVSSRLDNSQGIYERMIKPFFTFVGWENFIEMISRLFSNNLVFKMAMYEGANNYYEMPIMVFTCIIFFVLAQYAVKLLRERKDTKYFVYQCVIIAVAAVLLFSRGMWNAFNTFTVVTFRGSFVYFPVTALLFAKMWEYAVEEKKISLWGVALGATSSIILLLLMKRRASMEVTNYYSYFLCVFLLVVVLYAMAKLWDGIKCHCAGALCVLLICTTIFETHITTNRVMQIEDPLTYLDGNVSNDMTKALDIIKENDPSVIRVLRDYNDWGPLGDSMVEGYSCIVTYNSTLDRNITAFYDNAFNGLHTGGAIYGMHQGIIEDPLNYTAMSVAGVRYYVSQQDLPYEWCQQIGQVGDIKIYQNINARPLMMGYTKWGTKQEFEEASQEEKMEMLWNKILVDNDLDLPKVAEDVTIQCSDMVKVKDNYLKGEVTALDEAYLMLSIPDEGGWTVCVDGKEVEKFNADYGFMGIVIPKGQHIVEARYHIPNMKLGLMVCGFGIVILLINVLMDRRRKKHRPRNGR